MQAPDDLTDWSLHCFCLGARVTPHAEARANGRLLLAARPGVPVRSVAQADLARLEAMRLLVRTGDTVRPAFPILCPQSRRML